MNKKDMILTYIYNLTDTAEREYEEYIEHIRYCDPDEVEMLEQLIRKIRRNTLREVLKGIMRILSLTNR